MTSIVRDPPASRLLAGAAGLPYADKLRIPRPGIAVLHRPRITGLIDSAVSRPVALLTGPPGAGKTLAAARWALGKPPGRRPAWLTLDAADSEPGRFWQYVTAALTGVGVPAPPADVEPGGLPRWLASAVAAEGPAIVLVLDDIHLIAGSDALAELAALIRHEPPRLRLLLAGRSAPALARLRLSGDLTEIGAADLACTSAEIRAYFDMLGTPLPPAELAEVARRTEGWLAGLRLVALGAGAGPAGGQALVFDYIEDEVLGPLPADVRAFLLRTCLTPTIRADLASNLTGDSSAAGVLEQLSRSGSLVEAVAPEAGEYRYHPMLREALAACLLRELPAEVPELHRRVARWHAAHRDLPEAVRAAAEAADWDLASRVLRSSGPSVMLSADSAAVEATLALAPPDRIGTDAALAMALAAGRLWQGDADGAVPHLECVQYALDGLAGRDRVRAELWLSALRVLYRTAAASAEAGWLDQELAQAGQAHADARGPEHEALGVLWLALGFAALTEFDLQRARSALLHAGSQLSAGGLLALRERGRCWEAVAAALYGDLAAAARLVASVTDGPHGRDTDLVPVLALAGAAVSLGRDDLDEAATLLDQAGDLGVIAQRPAGEPSVDLLAGLLRARLAVADGNLAGARGLVRWLSDLAAPPRPPGAAAVVALLDADISLAAGERDRARATLTGAAARPLSGAQAAVGQARLLIADEDDKAALRLVEPVLAEPPGACSTTDRIRALLAAAVAHRRLSQTGEAAELLSQALALAEPEDACGPFLLAGPAVRSALTVLINPASRCAAFAGKILDRFDGRLSRPAASQPAALLTDSEMAVLRFLPSHMTNQEIAESLFLSINTIKTHLSSVYRKLGVANRRQAIAQARRLDLLLRGGRGHPLVRPAAQFSTGSPQAERQPPEREAVKQQPGSSDGEQQHKRDGGPDEDDDPGREAEDSQHSPDATARHPGRGCDADVGDAVRDEVDTDQERQQEQAQVMVTQKVHPGEYGDDADHHVRGPHATAPVARGETLPQPGQPRYQDRRADQDRHDSQRRVRPDEEDDAESDHGQPADRNGWPGLPRGRSEQLIRAYADRAGLLATTVLVALVGVPLLLPWLVLLGHGSRRRGMRGARAARTRAALARWAGQRIGHGPSRERSRCWA
jgi:LuxR family maltose regulon positive regulatory protein